MSMFTKNKSYIWVTFRKEGIHMYPAAATDTKLATGDWLTQAWLEEFINPVGWTDWRVWDKYAGWRVYDVGCAVIEILTALKGPAATMELIDRVAEGDTYDQAFEKTYGIKWVDAVPIISRTILKEYKF